MRLKMSNYYNYKNCSRNYHYCNNYNELHKTDLFSALIGTQRTWSNVVRICGVLEATGPLRN